jgi:hypothetical protein
MLVQLAYKAFVWFVVTFWLLFYIVGFRNFVGNVFQVQPAI